MDECFLKLSCHVSDHTQTQDGDEEELSGIQEKDRYIHHAIIQIPILHYFSGANQADHDLERPLFEEWRGEYCRGLTAVRGEMS